MVFYFETTAEDGTKYLMYMGKDKYENEDLIKYGLPEGKSQLTFAQKTKS